MQVETVREKCVSRHEGGTRASERRESALSCISPSWQDYVDVVLMDSGHVTSAAIHSRRGRKWAGSPDFRVSTEEVQVLVASFQSEANLGNLRLSGFYLDRRHYTLSRVSRDVIVGRDASSGGGCVVYRCHSCLLVALYGEGDQGGQQGGQGALQAVQGAAQVVQGGHPGGCFNAVLQLGDFLVEQGF